MSVFVFRIFSPALPSGTPASDLDGEEWTFSDVTIESATKRADRRLASVFCFASRERVEATSLRFVGEYPNLRAYERATEAA